MTKKIAILILAAGTSSRMEGRDKLLELIKGQDLLSRVTEQACATGFSVFVTLGTDAKKRAQAIANAPVTIIPVADASQGMSVSLKAGIRSLPPGLNGVLIMLADMPEITTDDLSILLTHFAEVGAKRVVRGTDETGHPGHPVILPARLFNRVGRLSGDQGARELLMRENVSLVQLPRGHATTDLDTPEDWISWRAGKHLA